MIRICMIGTGYVGLVSGACLADFGHGVTCVDIDGADRGPAPRRDPVLRAGARDLVAKNVRRSGCTSPPIWPRACASRGRLHRRADAAVRTSGEADLTYVMEVGKQIGKLPATTTRSSCTKSTVPVGTARKLAAVIAQRSRARRLRHGEQPRVPARGLSIEDFMRPDRVVIGTETPRAEALMREIYRPLFLLETPIVHCSRIETAELIKYARNSFLAVKIIFINEIANLCREGRRRRHAGGEGHGPGPAHRHQVPARGPRLRRHLLPQGHQRDRPHRPRARRADEHRRGRDRGERRAARPRARQGARPSWRAARQDGGPARSGLQAQHRRHPRGAGARTRRGCC